MPQPLPPLDAVDPASAAAGGSELGPLSSAHASESDFNSAAVANQVSYVDYEVEDPHWEEHLPPAHELAFEPAHDLSFEPAHDLAIQLPPDHPMEYMVLPENEAAWRERAHSPIRIVPDTPPPSPPPSGARRSPRAYFARALHFFGYGRNNKPRKELVTVIWAVVSDTAQIITIIALLAYSAHHKSALVPDKSEWDACGKPLGVWDSLWVARLTLDIGLSYWRWSLERTKRDRLLRDLEMDGSAPRGSSRISRTQGGGNIELGTVGPPAQRRITASQARANEAYPKTYVRLTGIGSTTTLVWFVLVHIFLYSSIHSCRHTSPHLWWLTFGVLSVMYLMILEVVMIAMLVFVVGPILYLAWSVFLLCIGRHPIQNPHYIKPEVGKLPRAVVDAIPLVLYIPPPPEDFPDKQPPPAAVRSPKSPSASLLRFTAKATAPANSNIPNTSTIAVPAPAHTVAPPISTGPTPSAPPVNGTPTAPARRHRFRFLRVPFKRRRASLASESAGGGKGKGKGSGTWEDQWERGAYALPFVRLEGNRAACAICLEDFEAPQRVDGEDKEGKGVAPVETSTKLHGEGTDRRGGGGEDAEADALRLEDAGQGVQPLRLLACGHAFHKTCLDPWLTDVSGRCPVCQRPVIQPEEPVETGRERRQRVQREERESRRTNVGGES
ncbi:hypothetical protein FA95DRAFT_1604035 [Auriscalpium vulgare]|uniref:Uncharacterized protein n=1 Tax=Auriscalpium vulgare TaxID=40419 RepID=A0ACB8S1Z1_9AGAM|nr:hypothetical protein FA95DRAFT_1604035 [Auriscalpium vulgare]